MESAQLAADEINAEGGIHGRPLEMDFQDHQCDPKTALSLFESLSSAKEYQHLHVRGLQRHGPGDRPCPGCQRRSAPWHHSDDS